MRQAQAMPEDVALSTACPASGLTVSPPSGGLAFRLDHNMRVQGPPMSGRRSFVDAHAPQGI